MLHVLQNLEANDHVKSGLMKRQFLTMSNHQMKWRLLTRHVILDGLRAFPLSSEYHPYAACSPGQREAAAQASEG